MRKIFIILILQLVFISCTPLKQEAQHQIIPKLKFLSSIEIPFGRTFEDTKVGGLSSIDYDKNRDQYYLICDDRSVYNDARFYTAKIDLQDNQLQAIRFTAVTTLLDQSGHSYGNWNSSPSTACDPEEIRYNPKSNSLLWISEGARIVSKEQLILQNPSLNYSNLNGRLKSSVPLPAHLNMQKEEKGPRNNGTLEGITFDFKYKKVYTNLEEPLIEDGNQATTTTGGIIRLYKFNVKTNKNCAQYAYQLEPIAFEPTPKGAFAVNGVSAIQYYGKNQLLVVERSYSTGKQACTVKVFLCDLKNATDVKNNNSIQNQKIELANKKLILNMDDLGIFIDNVEGITFGPTLKNGNPSLLFVTDNNFSDNQKTQLFLFEIVK